MPDNNCVEFCKYCGKKIKKDSVFCPYCGKQLNSSPNKEKQPQQPPKQYSKTTENQSENYQKPQPATVIVNNSNYDNDYDDRHPTNGIGKAGLILSIIGLFLGWIPALGWLIWFLGALFSFIGLFKSPRGAAVAGFIISFIDIIILAGLIGGITAIF